MNRTLNCLLGAAALAVTLAGTATAQTGSLQGRRTILNDGGTSPTTYNRITLTTPADATLTADYQLLLPPNDGNANDIIYTPNGTGTLEFTDGNGLFWRLLGNYSTTPYNGTTGNFVGTQDAQNLVIRAGGANSIQFWNGTGGGAQKMILDANGRLGLGVTPGGSYMMEIADPSATYHGLSVSTSLSNGIGGYFQATSPGSIALVADATDVGLQIGSSTDPVNGVEIDASGVGVLINHSGISAPGVGVSMDGSTVGLLIQNATTAIDAEGDITINNAYTGSVNINSAATSGGNIAIGYGVGLGTNLGIGEPAIATHLVSINGTAQTAGSATPNVRIDHLGGAAYTTIYVNDANNGLVTSDVNGDLIKYDENTALNPFAWLTTGNTIVGGNNILGTLNAFDIDIRTNNTTAATVSASTQNIAIGTANTATDRLVVNNSINVVGTAYNGGVPVYRVAGNNFLWEGAGGLDNTFVGNTGNTAVTSTLNTAVGRGAGRSIAGGGGFNTALGAQALFSANSGSSNVAIGVSASFNNLTGSNNTVVGTEAGNQSGSTSNNTFIGWRAGNLTTGGGNVMIGSGVGNAAGFAGFNDRLAIDNSNTLTPLILGNFATDQLTLNVATGTAASFLVVGTAQTAGVATPNVRLAHLGGASITNTYTDNANNGLVTSDANGDLTKWDETTVLNPFAWLTTGNTIVGGNNKFGTNSNDAVEFRTNGTQRFTLTAVGNLENPLGDFNVNDNISPTVDNTNSLGSDALRWAHGYFNGASVHIGPTNGSSLNTELALGYAANVGTLNVNGSNPEVSINAATGTVSLDPNQDATANASFTATAMTLNTGAATDLTVTETGIARNGGAAETLALNNSGGVLDVTITGSNTVTNNNTLGDADADIQVLRGTTNINTAGNAATSIGSNTNTSNVSIRANNDIVVDVTATTNDLNLLNIASTTTPVNMLTIEGSGAVRQKALTAMADEGIQFDATTGEFKLGHDTPGSNPITSARTVNVDNGGSLSFTTDTPNDLTFSILGATDNVQMTKSSNVSAGIFNATLTSTNPAAAYISIEGVGTGNGFNQYGVVGRANYTGGSSSGSTSGPFAVGLAGTVQPTGGTIRNWGVQGSSNTANGGSNVGVWGDATSAGRKSIGLVGMSGDASAMNGALAATWDATALLPNPSTIGVFGYNNLSGANDWALVSMGRTLLNGNVVANTTGAGSTTIGTNGNQTDVLSSTVNVGTGAYASTVNVGTVTNATVNVLGADVNVNTSGTGTTDIGSTAGGAVTVQGNGLNGLQLLGDGTAAGDNTIVIDPGTAGVNNEYDLVLNNIANVAPIQDLLWITATNEVRRATLTVIANEGVAFETSAFRLGSVTDGTNPIVSNRFIRMDAGGSLTFNNTAGGQTLVMDNTTGNIGVNQAPTATHELSVTSTAGSGGVAINNGSVALEIGNVTPPTLGAGVTASGTGVMVTLGGTGIVGFSSNGPSASVGFQSTGSAVSFDGDGDLFIDGGATIGDADADVHAIRGATSINTTASNAATTIGSTSNTGAVGISANNNITVDVASTSNNLVLNNIASTTVPVNMLSLDGSGNVRQTAFTGTADEGLMWDATTGDYKLGHTTDGSNPIVQPRYVRIQAPGVLTFNNNSFDMLTMSAAGVVQMRGLTVAINTPIGSGNTSIGNSAGQFQLASNELNVSTLGVISDAASAVEINDDLTTTGTTTFGDGTGTDNSTFNLGATGTISVNNSIAADLVINEVSVSRSNADIAVNPGAANQVTTNGSLNVAVNATIANNLTVTSGSATISAGNLTVTAGNLNVSNAGSNNTIEGALNANGNTAIGNSATDAVTLKGVVNINHDNGAATTNIGTGSTTGLVTIGGASNSVTVGGIATFGRGINVPIQTLTGAGPFNLTDNNYVAICNITTNETVNLPSPVGRQGRVIIIKVANTGNVTLQSAGGATIDGVASIVLNGGTNISRTVVSDGTNWFVIGN